MSKPRVFLMWFFLFGVRKEGDSPSFGTIVWSVFLSRRRYRVDIGSALLDSMKSMSIMESGDDLGMAGQGERESLLSRSDCETPNLHVRDRKPPLRRIPDTSHPVSSFKKNPRGPTVHALRSLPATDCSSFPTLCTSSTPSKCSVALTRGPMLNPRPRALAPH